MKGILIEKNGRNSVVMANDGKFMRVNGRRSWNQGDEVSFASPAAKAAKVASYAVMLVLVMALSLFGVYAANSYTVNLDVNPSIEIEVNAFNNVTSIIALNDDAGEIIIDLQDFVGMKLGPAVNGAILVLLDAGYLEADGTVVLSIDSKNKVKTVVREVSEAVLDADVEDDESDTDEDNTEDNSMKIYVGRITEDMALAAEQLNVPIGRIVLVQKAIEEGSTIEYGDVSVLSVQEIQGIRNISKTINKMNSIVEGISEESAGNGNLNQYEAISRKLVKEATKIEEEIAAIEEAMAGGDSSTETIERYRVLQMQFSQILGKLDDLGVQADDETEEIINGMAQMKGADKEEKERIREEVKIAKEAEQDAKQEEVRSRIEAKMNEIADKMAMLKSAKGKSDEVTGTSENQPESPGEGNTGSEGDTGSEGNNGKGQGSDNNNGNSQGNGNN
jgi:hypothetical protein